MERQQADAEARQSREIDTLRAREEAETAKVQEEERLKSESARIQTQQELDIRAENHLREVEVAQQNRQRAVVIEVEKVTRAKDLEIVAREREVELQRIDMEKALEVERKNIATVICERVAVEKTVAKEEERIKEVREVSEAERGKQVVVLHAQAEAEQELVRRVKQAETDETCSRHKAVEINNLAQAELEAAGKQAEARKKIAEGLSAERAAPGFADARVLEVTVAAKEKEGLAEARVHAERLLAEAKGEEEKGLAQARVQQAQASAKEKSGLVEARVLEEMLSAQARGEEQLGSAKAKATQDLGIAEAHILLQRLSAEAEGLGKKFSALEALGENARQHEEFRMQLEKNFEEGMATIAANKDIAKDQAHVLAAAMSKAKIDIVGGDGDFFNTFAKSLSVGKAIEGVVGKSPVIQDLLARVLTPQKAAEQKPAAVTANNDN